VDSFIGLLVQVLLLGEWLLAEQTDFWWKWTVVEVDRVLYISKWRKLSMALKRTMSVQFLKPATLAVTETVIPISK